MTQSLLNKIMSADEHVRIYALNGLAFTLANEIEDIMFWCFLTASGLSWEQAADKFYAHTRFNPKRQMTDEAVSSTLVDKPQLKRWEKLNTRIESLLGEGTLRNVIGHNAVMVSIYAAEQQGDDPKAVRFQARRELRQKRAMVERRNRKPATVGVLELSAYCEDLLELTRVLQNFGSAVLRGDPMQRLQYVAESRA